MRTPPHTVRPRPLLAVLAGAGIVASLMQTLVTPILGQLPELLDTTPANAAWVVTITLLVAAVSTPIFGRLGDMYGKRPFLLISIAGLVAGSVICALANSLVPMIIGRGLQGLGVGVIPLGVSALRDLLPRERLNSGIALISSSLGIGGALGLPVAAAIVENTSWHVLFWTAAALAAGAGIMVYVVVPETPVTGPAGRFDVLGAIGIGIALICLLLTLSKGSDWGWASIETLGLVAVAVAAAAAWGWWELRIHDPLVDLRVMARPRVLFTNAASILVGVAMFAQMLIVPQLLQLPTSTGYGLGQSMLAMGIWMAPAGLAMTMFSPVGARLTATRGPKITLFTGCLIIALGYLASMALMGGTWGLLAVSLIINTGVGFAYGAMPALIMGAVPPSETAAATSFNTLMRSIGSSVSASIVGAVLAQLSVSVAGHAIPTENGFRVGMLLGGGAALAAAAIVLAIPRETNAIESVTASRKVAAHA